MAYFVTGATGFIGSNLVPLLLKRTARKRGANADIHLLARESSLVRLEHLIDTWTVKTPAARARLKPVVGDLHEPLLGIDPDTIAALREQGIAHFFHLAAVYDMTAGAEVNQLANVEGTHHALELADAVGARLLHHVSSIAVAGTYRGEFGEDMFDVGQPLDHPYHRTKFESERLVRETATMPWRIYRPSIVVGDSRTGRTDKVDGPYYFFPLLKRAHRLVPDWVPLVGPELGSTNLVPVDFVAAALDHIAHQPGLNRHAFHLTDPNSSRVTDVLNTFAKVAGAPQFAAHARPGTAGGGASRCRRGPDVGARRASGAPGAARRGRHPRRDHRVRRPDRGVRHRTRAAGAGGLWDRGAGRWRATRRSSGITGRATWTPSSRNTAASRAPSPARPC